MTSLLHTASSYTTYQNLPYDDASPNQVLDLYVPNNNFATCPLIVWIHGGGWMLYSEDTTSQPVLPVYFNFVQRGFAVASVRYRLSQEATWPAQIVDVKAAIRYLRCSAAPFRLYKDKIGIWGASAGAHLAEMCAVTNTPGKFDVGSYSHTSSAVRVIMADYGPSDLTALYNAPYTGPAPSPATMVTNLLGGTPTSLPDLAADASPMTWVSAQTASTALMHGTADTVCPFSQSQNFYNALVAAGSPNPILVPAPGKGHADMSIYNSGWLDGVSALFRDCLQP